MKSFHTLMYQLQTALKVKKYIVTISTTQFYSQEQDRFVKMYILKHDRKEILSSASQIVIVKCLKQMLDCVKELEANRVEPGEWEAAVNESVNTNLQYILNTKGV